MDAIKHPCRVVSKAGWTLMDDSHSHEDCAVQPTTALHTRTLSGEISLPENITPSFSFGKMSLKVRRPLFVKHIWKFDAWHGDHPIAYTLQYSVQLLPFDVAGFSPEDGENAIIFQRTVDITSDYAGGTHPKASLPHTKLYLQH